MSLHALLGGVVISDLTDKTSEYLLFHDAVSSVHQPVLVDKSKGNLISTFKLDFDNAIINITAKFTK